ncbi:MAG: hypothetical protein ABIO70_18565 [Pseudomonadota bacterium]
MLTRRTAVLLPLIALCVATAWAEPSAMAVRAIEAGRWHGAANLLREDMELDPDDPEIATRLGMIYAQLGYYSDAAVALAFAQGGGRYEARSLGTHATVLRELGDLDGASALRTAELLMAQSETAEINAWLAAADDELAAGDLDMALDDGLQALTVRPESAMVHAWLADIYERRGEPDEAAFHLWLSTRDGTLVARAAQHSARIALRDDAPLEALEFLRAARKVRSRSEPLAVLLVETYRRMGWLDDALELLGRDRILYGERPDYLLALARLKLDLGQRDEACQALRQASATYPHLQDPRALWEERCR